MTSYDYFKQQKEQLEREQFKTQVLLEVEFMVKTAMNQIKEEILGAVQREIQVQVDLIMNGKKVDNVDIGKIVVDEVLKQLQSSI